MITKPFTITPPPHGRGAFTLAELLISVVVLAIIILMVAQLMNSATAITRIGNKHIDTDTQARTVLDRMAVDLAQMLKRTDVDYYIKQPVNYNGHGNGHGYGQKVKTGQQGSDQIAFFSQVPGYYPSSGSQSPLSLVAYRVNQDSNSASYLKLERMGKGLLWNGVSNTTNPKKYTTPYPIIFLPGTISGTAPWSAAVNNDNTSGSQDPDYETIGPQVFRFEYYYLLKNGNVTDVPWDTTARPTQTTITSPQSIGLADVEAIAVAIAVIDPASRSLISDSSLFDLGSDMADFKTAPGKGNGGAKKIGDMEDQWKTAVLSAASTGQTSAGPISKVPRAAASTIRIYNRYFDLRTL
jgi:hypothetical protein